MICRKCYQDKPRKEFSPTGRDCRACIRQYQRAYRAKRRAAEQYGSPFIREIELRIETLRAELKEIEARRRDLELRQAYLEGRRDQWLEVIKLLPEVDSTSHEPASLAASPSVPAPVEAQ